jgi:hypothetical protein
MQGNELIGLDHASLGAYYPLARESSKERDMRTILTIAALAIALGAPASAQMIDHPPAHQPETTGQGGAMMCGGTVGQSMTDEKTGKPMQMSMMCACCQNMMKKGMMQKMQKMPEKMPDMPGMDTPK